MCETCRAYKLEATPLLVDFTTSQHVYEGYAIPKALLRWRAVVGQEIKIVMPIMQVGDCWRIRSITLPKTGLFAPDRDSDAFGPDACGAAVQPQQVAAKTGLDYAGQAFTLVAQKGGIFELDLYRSNTLRGTRGKSAKLELHVLWPEEAALQR
jgi:hypothetical protein